MSPSSIMRGGPFDDEARSDVRALVRALGVDGEAETSIGELDDATVEMACGEGLGPLLGARVAGGHVVVPAGRRKTLVREHQMCLASNMMRGRAVRTMADIYRDRAIPLLLLKGMALIQSTLGWGERSMVDVDVLVPASRWREACDLAARAGLVEIHIQNRSYTGENDYVRSFTTPANVTVEIHRFVCEQSLLRLDYEGPDGIFARAQLTDSGFLIPEDGDLFLTLAAHAAKHTFELPLRSFLDGLFLIRRKPLRLEELWRRARDWGMQTTFELWLRSLHALATEAVLEMPTPPPSLQRRMGRFVWSRTRHASAWQRFIRLAWIADTKSAWMRHVATRVQFRALDVLRTIGRRMAADP